MTDKQKIRYCSECGHIGNVPDGKKSCCPTSKASRVSLDIAAQAYAGFHAVMALAVANRMIHGSKGRPVKDDG